MDDTPPSVREYGVAIPYSDELDAFDLESSLNARIKASRDECLDRMVAEVFYGKLLPIAPEPFRVRVRRWIADRVIAFGEWLW